MFKLNITIILLFFNCFAESPSGLVKTEVKKFGKIYLKPNGFIEINSGGAFMGGIHEISISFERKEYVDIDQARKYIINSIENFLPQINKSKAVKYFDTFPMNEKQLYVLLCFVTEPWKTIKDQKHIGMVSQSNGKIRYDLCNPGLEPNTEIYVETYAEAYEKVYGVPISERPWMKEYCQKQTDI